MTDTGHFGRGGGATSPTGGLVSRNCRKSQIRAVLSQLAVTMRLPSGLNAAEVTFSV